MAEQQQSFTKGPWLIDRGTVYALDESGTCNRFSVRVQPGFKLNYGPHCEHIEDGEVEATTHLIAAAPALFEALQTFEKQWNACGPNSDFGRYFQSVRDAAVEALAQAKADHWLNTSRATLASTQAAK
jgi:hypothetical protein